jgi:hypothetical protein
MAFVFTEELDGDEFDSSDSEIGEDSLDSDSGSDGEYIDMPPLIEEQNVPFHLFPLNWMEMNE